jgi:sigma-B regulation protein RsbU (phosphoserine phosphatase)
LFNRFNSQLVVPLRTSGKVLGFLALGEKLSEEPYSREDKELLLAVCEQVAIALDYSQLIGVVAEQRKLEREMQIAQDVQQRLFPQEFPTVGTLDYHGLCRTASGVGGDYFDFLLLEKGSLGITVADIAGKGLSASLLMASLQALVRSHAPTHTGNLGELAGEINRHLCESTDDARFATFFFGVYQEEDSTLRYLNAGHNPPIVIRKGGEIERLQAGGMVLGLFEEKSHLEQEVRLEKGDTLIVFSDGITEAMDENGVEFGDHRLLETARKHSELPSEKIASEIMAEVGRFTGPVPPHDDMTLIVARVS